MPRPSPFQRYDARSRALMLVVGVTVALSVGSCGGSGSNASTADNADLVSGSGTAEPTAPRHETGTPATTRHAPVLSDCKKLTPTIVSAAIGRQVKRLSSPPSGTDTEDCAFTTGSGPGADVRVLITNARVVDAAHAFYMKQLAAIRDAGVHVTELPGLGDEANLQAAPAALNMRAGQYFITLGTVGGEERMKRLAATVAGQ